MTIDADHYVELADVTSVIPVGDNEVPDLILDGFIQAASQHMDVLTNRTWTPTAKLWENIQNLTSRYVAISILTRRGEFDAALKMKELLEYDIKDLLKSPYLNQEADGGTTGKSGIITVVSEPKSPYSNPYRKRYLSTWAKNVRMVDP